MVPPRADARKADGARDLGLPGPGMRLVSFKPLVKAALRGFATVQLPIGLTIEDCPVFIGRNGVWATLPAKAVLDREGRQVRADGKPQFAALLKWRSRELADKFSASLIELVRQQHPDAFGDGR